MISNENDSNKQELEYSIKEKIEVKEKENETDIADHLSQEEYSGLAGTKSNVEESLPRKTSLNSQHVLNSTWVFWYISRKEKVHNVPYEERLKQIASFSTLEDFFKYYVYLKPASEIERNSDLSIFKQGSKPLWESCPDGGCWFVRFRKNDDPWDLDMRWEKLIFALIGEQFQDTNLLGAVLSIRGRETIVELWFNYRKNEIVKANIGEKMKEFLNLDKATVLYFKDNEKSLQDRSTLKNAETYNVNTNYNRKNTYY